MSVTESLRKDHQILRAELRLLEGAMQVAPEAQLVLREMCWSLDRMLEDHIQHEVEALRPFTVRIQALTQAQMAQDHAEQRIILRAVNDVLLGGMSAPMNQVVPPLAPLIEELREHMAREEQEVFPMVDQMAEEQLAKHHQITRGGPLMITEEMTVNHVLRIHPSAQEIFQAFHVDCEQDGTHCLDELYWRRGLNVAALLNTLNRSAAQTASVWVPVATNHQA